jgi:hypothetical protein
LEDPGVEGALSDVSPRARIRWFRVWAITAVVAAVIVGAITLARFQYSATYLNIGIDYDTLIGAARSFLAGDGFYPAEQLAGPWVYHQDEPQFAPPILYPPHTLILFIPFTVLPAILWWLIPFAVTAWALWRLRPHPAAWLAIVLLLGVPESREGIFWGNPVMWMTAATAAGFVLGWPAVVVFLKPTLAPFAFAGMWKRSWWLALAALVGFNLALLPMWFDWITVIRNSTLNAGFSLYQYPLMSVPVVAWLGSRSGPLWWRLGHWRTAGFPIVRRQALTGAPDPTRA